MTAKPHQTGVGRRFSLMGRATALVATAAFSMAPVLHADIPDKPFAQRSGLSGYYKVAANTDPFFGSKPDREWFLDFGEGVLAGKTSGSVAVSMRENPNVKVKLLVWQLDPTTRTLIVGAPTEDGSRKAVALAQWQVVPTLNGVTLLRGDYEVSLRRANSGE
jgi:hypothetical protein